MTMSTKIMGILNVTPDSFSDGGRFDTPEKALAQARRLIAEGADIIDIGGESTRPDAKPVSAQEEMDRVLPVIKSLRLEYPHLMLSIDTSAPEVMQAAVAEGVHMINDVRALQKPNALEVAAQSSAQIVLTHMQGTPQTMQVNPQYGDVVQEVSHFLQCRVNACLQAGIARERLIIDPGFGFGKTVAHNLTLLRELPTLKKMGLPVLVGLSRKAMIGRLLGAPVDDRLGASVALALIAHRHGADIVRVHDVGVTRQAIAMTREISAHSTV